MSSCCFKWKGEVSSLRRENSASLGAAAATEYSMNSLTNIGNGSRKLKLQITKETLVSSVCSLLTSRNLCWDCWFSLSSSMIVVVWALILDCPLQTEAEKMLQYALLSYNTWEEAWRMASPAPLPTAAAEIWGWWDAGSRQEDLLWSTAWILCTH